MLIVSIGDDFDMLDGPSHGENLCKHILRDPGAQIADGEMGPPLNVGERRCMHDNMMIQQGNVNREGDGERQEQQNERRCD